MNRARERFFFYECVNLRAAGPVSNQQQFTIGELRSYGCKGANKYGLANLAAPQRLALEMSLHESDERRALDNALYESRMRYVNVASQYI